jgi:hypothetical protein
MKAFKASSASPACCRIDLSTLPLRIASARGAGRSFSVSKGAVDFSVSDILTERRVIPQWQERRKREHCGGSCRRVLGNTYQESDKGLPDYVHRYRRAERNIMACWGHIDATLPLDRHRRGANRGRDQHGCMWGRDVDQSLHVQEHPTRVL